jgi:hypothetical protein
MLGLFINFKTPLGPVVKNEEKLLIISLFIVYLADSKLLLCFAKYAKL